MVFFFFFFFFFFFLFFFKFSNSFIKIVKLKKRLVKNKKMVENMELFV